MHERSRMIELVRGPRGQKEARTKANKKEPQDRSLPDVLIALLVRDQVFHLHTEQAVRARRKRIHHRFPNLALLFAELQKDRSQHEVFRDWEVQSNLCTQQTGRMRG